MSWVRFDDATAFHPKLVAAGNECTGAWVRMTCWSAAHLTDGAVPLAVAALIAGPKVLARLCGAGLLEQEGADYRIHDYLKYNASAEQVRAKRSADCERKFGRAAQDSSRIPRGIQADSDRIPSIPSHPIPSDRKKPEETRSEEATASPSAPRAAHGEGAEGKGKKKPDALKPEVDALVEHYRERWIETRRPADGKPPGVQQADYLQLRAVVKAHGPLEARALLGRYLDDADPWLAKIGHPLRHLTSRIDGYRANGRAGPRRDITRGQAPAMAHATETKVEEF